MNTANTPHSFEQKLSAISRRIRDMEPELHTALLIGIIGGLKGAASYDPQGISGAVNSIEIVLESFEENLQQQV
jgi:hypothetical protein